MYRTPWMHVGSPHVDSRPQERPPTVGLPRARREANLGFSVAGQNSSKPAPLRLGQWLERGGRCRTWTHGGQESGLSSGMHEDGTFMPKALSWRSPRRVISGPGVRIRAGLSIRSLPQCKFQTRQEHLSRFDSYCGATGSSQRPSLESLSGALLVDLLTGAPLTSIQGGSRTASPHRSSHWSGRWSRS